MLIIYKFYLVFAIIIFSPTIERKFENSIRRASDNCGVVAIIFLVTSCAIFRTSQLGWHMKRSISCNNTTSMNHRLYAEKRTPRCPLYRFITCNSNFAEKVSNTLQMKQNNKLSSFILYINTHQGNPKLFK